MNVRMSVDNLSSVTIGYAGERSVESVTIDYSAWQTAYGEGVLFLHLLRPMDEGLYPVVLAVDGTDATWTISEADTAQTGHGEAQLEYRVNNAVKKSEVFGVDIIRSLSEGEQPEGWDTFMDDMEDIAATAVENAGIATDKASEASTSADEAEASASASQASAVDSEAWAVGQRNGVDVTSADETYNNNAKYYAGLSEDSALNAAQSESNAESAEARINETVDDFDTTVQTALGEIDSAKDSAIDDVADEATDAVSAVGTAGTQAVTAVNTAKTSAVAEINGLINDASGYATVANQAKTDAQSYATNAQNSASNASQSATDANTAKTDAQTARTDAQTARDNAQTYSRDSEAWANGTRNGSAIPSTDVAYEKNSKYWAEQAEATVTDLADDVADLNEDLTNIEKVIPIVSSASGSIASFSDGADGWPVKKLTCEINPVQDLHGYEYPWPGGGGKNLFDINNPFITAVSAGYIATYAPRVEDGKFYNGGKVGESAGASYTIPVNEGATYTAQFVINGESANWEVRAVTLNDNVWASNTVLANSQSAQTGAVTVTVTIPSGKTHLYVACYSATQYGSWETNIQIESGSTATSWSPYSNICPISGHTDVDVYRTGVNVWDEEWENTYYNNDGVKTTNNNLIGGKNFINVKPNTAYYGYIGSSTLTIAYFDANKEFLYRTVGLFREVFTTPSNCHYISIATAISYGGTYNNDISINYPSTDHDYHAYQGQSVTYQLDDTVYGGTLTINDDGSGTIVSTMAMVDMGAMSWSKSSAADFYTNNLIGIVKPPTNASTVTNALCSSYHAIAWQGPASDGDFAVSVNGAVSCRNSAFATAEDFKTSVTGQQLVYELATPVTIDLTAQEVIETLKGQNNIWHDANGNTTAEYRADTKLYIDGKIADLQTLIASL